VTYPPSSLTYGSDVCVARANSQCIFAERTHTRAPSSEQSLFRPPKLLRTRSKKSEWQSLQDLLLGARDRYVRLAFGILRNKEDAEDAVQNAFLSAYRHFDSFEGRSALTTWLTRIVMNAALMVRRKRIDSAVDSLDEFSQDAPFWTESIPPLHPDQEIAYAKNEMKRILRDLLAVMPPELRIAFTAHYYIHLSTKEASSLLGISLGTYKTRLFRARQHLIGQARTRILTLPQRSLPPRLRFDPPNQQGSDDRAPGTQSRGMFR
jgi:RNA polymerase sigma-70 factor, ECF subfamily